MLSTQKIFLDKSSVEGHRKILSDFLSSAVIREGVTHTKHDCDAMYFGANNLSLISMMRAPLHMVIKDPSDLEIRLDMLIERERGDEGQSTHGKGNLRSHGTKSVSLFNANEYNWVLFSRARVKELDCYNPLNLNVSRPNSINEVVDSLECGGSTMLQEHTLKHLLVNRVSRKDSMVFTCVNLYMWLQKCILYYSSSKKAGLEVLGRKVAVGVTKLSAATLFTMAELSPLNICADLMTDEELMILTLALEGHEGVRLTKDGAQDIFSSVLTEHQKYNYFTKQAKDRTLKMEFTLFPPEIALSHIYSIVEKLGIASDWLRAPGMVRGLATYKLLTEGMCPSKARDNHFVINAPTDTHNGTLVGVVSNGCMHDSVEHTNLAASTPAMLLDCMIGHQLLSNVHYTAETLGLLNRRIFSNTTTGRHFYRSYMIENDLYLEGAENKLVRALTSNTEAIELSGNVSFFKNIMDTYVKGFSVKYASEHMWLQVSHFYGKAMCNNSTDMLDRVQPINSSNLGVTITDMEKANELQNWLTMHYLTDDTVFAGGLSKVGDYPLPSYSESMNERLSLALGNYKCVLVEVSLAGEAIARPGYDSRIGNDMFYSVTYFSQGAEHSSTTESGIDFGMSPRIDDCCAKDTELSIVAKQMKYNNKQNEDAYVNGIMYNRHHRSQRTVSNIDVPPDQVQPKVSIPRRKNGILTRIENERVERADAVDEGIGTLFKSRMGSARSGSLMAAAGAAKARRRTVRLPDNDSVSWADVDKTKYTADAERVDTAEIPNEQSVSISKLQQGNTVTGVEETSRTADQERRSSRLDTLYQKSFMVKDNSGGGNCAFYAMKDAFEDINYGESFSQLTGLVKWKVDGEWQDSETIHAVAQMMGADSTILTTYTDGQGTGSTTVSVKDPIGHVYILHTGNHFQAMLPRKTGTGLMRCTRDWSGENRVLQSSLKPEVAVAYQRYLKLNNVDAAMVVANSDGNFTDLTISPDADIPEMVGLGAMKGKRGKKRNKYDIHKGHIRPMPQSNVYFSKNTEGPSLWRLFSPDSISRLPIKR